MILKSRVVPCKFHRLFDQRINCILQFRGCKVDFFLRLRVVNQSLCFVPSCFHGCPRSCSILVFRTRLCSLNLCLQSSIIPYGCGLFDQRINCLLQRFRCKINLILRLCVIHQGYRRIKSSLNICPGISSIQILVQSLGSVNLFLQCAIIQFVNNWVVAKQLDGDQKLGYLNIQNDAVTLEELTIVLLVQVFSQNTVTNALLVEATQRTVTACKVRAAQCCCNYLCIIVKDILKFIQILCHYAFNAQSRYHSRELIVTVQILNCRNNLSCGQCVKRLLQCSYTIGLVVGLNAGNQRILRATGNTVCSKNAEDNSKSIIF